LKALKAAKIQIVAVSYDDPKVLQAFAKKQKIEFPLLSDPESKTIEAFETRNEDAKDSRIDGVPYPGTFLIDAEGIVQAKLFHEGYEKRHHGDDIIKTAKELADKSKPAKSK